MANHMGGVVDTTKTYTQHSLGEILGRGPDWVIEHVVEQGCRATKVGWLFFISGQSFQLWIENRAEMAPAKKPRVKQEAG